MRVLCVHHESPIEGGTYDRVISEAGHDIVRWSPFAGEPAPSPGDADAIVVYGGAVHPDADGTEPWLAIVPGLFILLTTTSVNAAGDRFARRPEPT